MLTYWASAFPSIAQTQLHTLVLFKTCSYSDPFPLCSFIIFLPFKPPPLPLPLCTWVLMHYFPFIPSVLLTISLPLKNYRGTILAPILSRELSLPIVCQGRLPYLESLFSFLLRELHSTKAHTVQASCCTLLGASKTRRSLVVS